MPERPVPPQRRLALGVAIAVSVLLGLGGWWVVAGRAHDAVSVGSLFGLQCKDPKMARIDPHPRVVLVPDMDCRHTVDVTRLGRLPVRLVEVRYPGLGPHGALSAQVDSLRWAGRTYRPVPDADDAIFRVDKIVPESGFPQEAVAHLSYRAGTCSMAAVTTSSRMPVVTLRAFGLPREVRPEATTFLVLDPRRAGRSCPGDSD
ncbi:hypothetical protein GCM10027596_04990 [Nocardioides korecus]